MKTIRVKIDQYGQPTISAEGYVGSSCKLATAPLEQALGAGADNVKKDPRPELFRQTVGRQTVTTKG